MLAALTERNDWKLATILPRADPLLACVWYAILVLRGVLPPLFAVAMGVLVGAIERGDMLTAPLTAVGIIFVLLQVVTPVHQTVGLNLGDRTAAWHYDRLTEASVRRPGSAGHLEDPTLSSDLVVARDFDLGMDRASAVVVDGRRGLASAIVLIGYAWWAGLLLAAAWLSTRTGCCARAPSGATAIPRRCAALSATPPRTLASSPRT